MATSPNYAWAEPDNSSLVKNGASDIRTLGDAIDTSVWNVGFGQAGKNKIINGDFRINQRNFTSNTTTASFNFDRWAQLNTGGTFTVTPQTFTPGSAPVAGYEGSTYLQGISAGQSAASDNARFRQKIESVRTFAGQTVTVSFWAKTTSGTPKIGIELGQSFGSSGGASSFVSVPLSAITISTSWVRYSASIAVPSISGKTIAGGDDALDLILWVSAGSDFATRASSIGIQNNTFQIWGVQVEYGSKATPFQTATGTIQGETYACQYYFKRVQPSTAYAGPFGFGYSNTTTQARIQLNGFSQQMRTSPSITFSTASNFAVLNAAGNQVATATSSLAVTPWGATATITTGAGTQTAGQGVLLADNGTTSATIDFSAEL